MVMRIWINWLICLLASLLLSSSVFAQVPEISINLSLDKTYYGYGEPVGVSVEVVNESGSEILINRGFENTVFYLKMRIIDPSGRLMGFILYEPRSEFPDAPAIPVIFRDGRHIRALPWESLDSDWQRTSATDKLQDHYPLQLPGYYSARVQVSAMTFKAEDPGNIHNYDWQGVLKSDTVYFYYEGATEVEVKPERWPLAWLEAEDHEGDLVEVKIWPEVGKTVGDYVPESIRFNNMEPFNIKVKKSEIILDLDAYRAISSLGPVEKGQWYPVVVSGKLTSGAFFGGGAKVKIR
jgi:hypothetical protein